LIIGLLGYGLNPPTEHLEYAKQLGLWVGSQNGVLVCGGFQGTLEAGLETCLQQGGSIELYLEKDRVADVPNEWHYFTNIVSDTDEKHQQIAERIDIAVAIGGGKGSRKLIERSILAGREAFIADGLTSTYEGLKSAYTLPFESILQELENRFRN